MQPEATILHADLDSFYASVEQRDDVRLRGRPVIVGAGVVLAASYEAKRYGIQGGMGGREARRRCPHAAVVPPRMAAYSQASRDVFAIFRDTTPVVEPLSIDEAFLDVRGMRRIAGSPEAMAWRLKRRVLEEVGLPISIGVATTKHLAKVASAACKPDGLLVVEAGHELGFLHPLPVERLWGVGPVTAGRLHAHGLRIVADIARCSEEELMAMIGRAAGRHLHALAHNRDPRRVRGRRRRSMGTQRAMGRRAPRTPQALDASLVALVDRLTRRMRAAHRVARTVVLRLRFDDFTRATRSHSLNEATAETDVLLAALRQLLRDALPLIRARGITLLGITYTNLSDARAVQLAFALEPRSRATLDAAVDGVRDRFGTGAITRAVLLGHDPGVSVPLLPDREE